jgi:long-chain acyl-CoA synthetase
VNDILKSLNFRDIYFRDRAFGREMILGEIEHLSRYFDKNMISDSPFILLSAYNHIKTVIAYYAILKSGRIAAILNPESKSIELTEIIKDIDPAALIFINTNTVSFNYDEEIVFRKPDNEFSVHSDLRNVCTLIFTNAEDGYAKGAMLTDKNLLTEINDIISIESMNAEKVGCALLPFYHLFGLVKGVLTPVYRGYPFLICELNLLNIINIAEQIKKYKVTNIYSVPSIYYILSKVPGISTYLEFVNDYISGGNKLSKFIFEGFKRNAGGTIREGYGLTEASPACTVNYRNTEVNINSIGKAFPSCSIKILDEKDNECKTGKLGEICIKGDNVFKGYFNNEELSKKTLKNGWLHTGDLGTKDDKGYIYFAGLKKNMINVAGNNVYPKELERFLKLYENVESIEIFSKYSEVQGNIVGARIKLRNHSENSQKLFKDWCIKNINNMKLPKIWEFID